MSEALAEAVINRHKRGKKKVKLITIDLDPTVDPAHGHQQLSLLTGFMTATVTCRWLDS